MSGTQTKSGRRLTRRDFLSIGVSTGAGLLLLGGCGANGGGAEGGSGGSYRWAAINSTSSHYVYVTQVADAISQASEQNWTVLETGGIEENHTLLERDEAQVAISAPATLYQATHGTGTFEDVGPNEDLRVLWTWVIPPQNMVARADADVSSLEDLTGKEVLAGGTGTSTETIFQRMFDILGITPNYVSGSLDDGVEFMQNGRIVAFGKATPGFVPDSTYQQMQSTIDLVPLGFTEQQVNAIKEELPYVSFIQVPADTVIPGAPAFTTWAAPLTNAVRSDFPEEDAYQAVKAAAEAKEEIAEAYQGTKDVDYIDDTIEAALTADTPLHPGVVRYFEEQGAQVPEELIAEQ